MDNATLADVVFTRRWRHSMGISDLERPSAANNEVVWTARNLVKVFNIFNICSMGSEAGERVTNNIPPV